MVGMNMGCTALLKANKVGKAKRKNGTQRGVGEGPKEGQGNEVAYRLALLFATLVTEDLHRGTRHYRTHSGHLLTSLDQIIQAARNHNLLITVPSDTTFYVPPDFAVCPYCEGKLYAGFTGWSQEPDGTWAGLEMEMECENEPDMEADEAAWDEWLESHSEMPYVYWLPVCEKVKRWINSQYRFAKGEFEAPLQRQPEWTPFDDLEPEKQWDRRKVEEEEEREIRGLTE